MNLKATLIAGSATVAYLALIGYALVEAMKIENYTED